MTVMHRVADWDNAYDNITTIVSSLEFLTTWAERAQEFREAMAVQGHAKLDIAYGPRLRNRLDLFMPSEAPKGLVVFIHGGYWMMLDKNSWSHLAAGPIAHGYAVAMPSYSLCPEVRIRDIVGEVGEAVEKVAEMVPGPINLTGHSAGGHLAARLVTTTGPLSQATRKRVRNTVPISVVTDLRPLMKTAMNADLRIDELEALAESPAMLQPIDGARVVCWVGAGERAEFIRQNALLANMWIGLGAATSVVEEPDRHHFNVVDGLTDPQHPLTQALLA